MTARSRRLRRDATGPDARENDAYRSDFLRKAGLRIVRVLNDDVLCDLDAIAELIAREAQMGVEGTANCSSRPHPSPLPKGEGAFEFHPKP
jgi:hypothetical protein